MNLTAKMVLYEFNLKLLANLFAEKKVWVAILINGFQVVPLWIGSEYLQQQSLSNGRIWFKQNFSCNIDIRNNVFQGGTVESNDNVKC
jgi:hypothetical protein